MAAEDEDDRARDDEQEHAGGDGEDRRPDDTLAQDKKCPECGVPVDDVRATCINCGYEYKDEDHEDTEAGNEFLHGSQIDDEGNELPDETPAEEGSDEGAADE